MLNLLSSTGILTHWDLVQCYAAGLPICLYFFADNASILSLHAWFLVWASKRPLQVLNMIEDRETVVNRWYSVRLVQYDPQGECSYSSRMPHSHWFFVTFQTIMPRALIFTSTQFRWNMQLFTCHATRCLKTCFFSDFETLKNVKLLFQMLVWLHRQFKCHILFGIMQKTLNSERATISPLGLQIYVDLYSLSQLYTSWQPILVCAPLMVVLSPTMRCHWTY